MRRASRRTSTEKRARSCQFFCKSAQTATISCERFWGRTGKTPSLFPTKSRSRSHSPQPPKREVGTILQRLVSGAETASRLKDEYPSGARQRLRHGIGSLMVMKRPLYRRVFTCRLSGSTATFCGRAIAFRPSGLRIKLKRYSISPRPCRLLATYKERRLLCACSPCLPSPSQSRP
jgi:hypothetical protein